MSELVYFVIPAADAEAAQTFYSGLFGWTFTPGAAENGFNIDGSSPAGGIFGGAGGDRPMPYFRVDDIGQAVEKVRELGGEAEDAQDIESGFMSHCRDTNGVAFGIWQPK